MEEIERIRAEVPAVALGLELARHEGAAGLRPPDLWAALRKGGALLDASCLPVLREAIERRAADSSRLERLLRFATSLRMVAATATSEEALVAAECAAVVDAPTGPLPLRAARASIAAEPDRGRRLALASARMRAEEVLATARADHVERLRDAAAELGLDPAGGNAAALESARRVLDHTRDAARESMAWAARRYLGPDAVPGGGLQAADVDWLLSGQAEGSTFPAGATRLTALSLLEAMGVSTRGSGLKLDMERRPGKLAVPLAARLGRADRAAAAILPAGTPSDLLHLLEALGRAMFLLWLARAPAPEDEFPGDPAVARGVGIALARAVLAPVFHRRLLRSSSAQVERAVRLLATGELVRVRRACARALSCHDLAIAGPRRAHADIHAELLRAADGAEHDARGHLEDALDPGAALEEVRARALAGRLTLELTERFDEDWFRNPRTGAYLRDLAGLGGGGTSPPEDLSHAFRALLPLLE